MRGAWTIAAALAAAAPAWASDHQYFVTSVDENQAVLLDLATRTKIGEVVTLDLIVLSKQPSTATGSPTYWVDGVQEVDCAGHRTRIMLVAAYSLDRSRKASSPNAAYRPWVANGAPDTQAIEAFVCRNVRNAGFRPVADLTAFQRDYFQQQRAAAAATSAPPPRAKAQPTPEETLAQEGDRAIEAARQAIEERKRNPPKIPAGPRYYVTSYDKTSAEVFDRATFRRSGAVVSMHSETLFAAPRNIGGLTYSWMDREYEFDCAQHRSRWSMVATFDLARNDRTGLPANPYGEWKANTGTADKDTENLLCSETVVPRLLPAADLDALQRSYAAYARSNADKWVLAQATAPAAPAAKPDNVQLKGLDLMVVEEGQTRALIVNRTSRARKGDIASIDAMTLVRTPETRSGQSFNWMESEEQVDCRGHLKRSRITFLHSLDLGHQEPVEGSRFGDWIPVPTTSIDYDSFMCQGVVAKSFRPIPDLASYAREYMAKASTAPAAKPPATALAPRASAGPARHDYLVADSNNDGAIFVDRASIRREGDLATFGEMNLLAKPETKAGVRYSWAEATAQFDCKLHRSRSRLDAMLTLDRKTRQAYPQPAFGPWDPNAKNTLGSMLEDLTCRGAGANNFTPAGDDLDGVAKLIMQAIREGVFK